MKSDATYGFEPRRTTAHHSARRGLWLTTKLAVIVLAASPAFAQYGGSTGMPGSASSTPSYGHGKAIGIGVGAAAAGALGVYFLTHRASKVTGCVVKGNDGLVLTDAKSKRTFDVLEGSADVKSGERLELKGKIKKNESGNPSFLVKSVAKDLGDCSSQASAAAQMPAIAQSK